MEGGEWEGDLSEVFCRIACFVPCDAVMLAKIPFGVTVGSRFRPKNIMVAFAHGVQQTGQADDEQISPAKTLTVDGMPELMHTNLVA